MKNWALSIVVVVFSITIISMLFPNGKTGKFIKSIFGLILIIVVLNPLTNLDLDNLSVDEFLATKDTILQNDYLTFIDENEIESHKKNCLKTLENMGIKNAQIDIDWENDKNFNLKITKVSINLRNAVIKSDKEHIVIIENVKNLILDYFNIDFDKLVIYE